MGEPLTASVYAIAAANIQAAVWSVVKTILVNVALGAVAKSLAKEPKQFLPPVNVTVRNTVENRRLIFGTVRAGGAIVFYGASGTNNKYLHYVVALAGHQVSDITDVWLDKVRITDAQIDGSGNVTAGPFSGKVSIWRYLGTQAQTVDTTLDSSFVQWTSTHRLRGIAYLHVRMERDDTAFPQGAPADVTALVDGALLYDPRLDSTNGGTGDHRRTDPQTWEFSRNSALVARWFLSGGSVVNDQASLMVMYGLRETDSRIIDSYTITAANECDEQLTGANTTPDGDQTRYTCDLECSTGETRRDILEAILATMAGRAVHVHGQWRLYAGAYDSPLHTLTEADLYSIDEEPISTEDTSGQGERYNAVAGVFRDAANSYAEQTSQFRTSSTYETQDGERIPKEIDLRGVTDKYRVQRLCEIEMRKSRNMRIVKLVGGLNLLKVAPWETFNLSHTRYGWSNRIFRCIERQFDFRAEAGRVTITAQTESSTVYTDLATADYLTPNDSPPVSQTEIPEAPTALVTVPQVDAVLVKWTRSVTPGVMYELQYSTAATMTSPTTVETPDTQYYLDRTATTTFYFRVRAKKNGQTSTWEPATNGTSGAAIGVTTTLSGSISPSSASSTGTGTPQTTNTVTATPSGGTAPYTYNCTFVSGGTSITINNPTTASPSFTAASLGSPETRSGTARIRITDNAATTFDIEFPVTIERTNTFSASAAGTPPLSKQANASNITSNNITATPSGGVGPFTYLWSIVSHDDPNSTPTINNSTSQTCTVTTNQAPSSQTIVTVTVRCAVTDTGNGSQVVNTNNVTIDHFHDNGA